MRRVLPLAFLVVAAAFCALPYLIGLVAPTLALPWAEYLAIATFAMAVVTFAVRLRSLSKFGVLPVYLLGCVSILLSSISWFGLPFIDAIFMLTALGASGAILVLTGAIVFRALNEGSANVRDDAERGA